MDFEQRQKAFADRVAEKVGIGRFTRNGPWKFTGSFGVSNRVLLVENAMQVGTGNFDSWSEVPEGIVLASVIRFPPSDELYFALVIKNDRDKFFQRLRKMKDLGSIQGEQEESRPVNRQNMRIKTTSTNSAAQETLLSDLLDSDEDNNLAEEEASGSENGNNIIYRNRNNTVALYLADDGKIYLRNKGFWDSFPSDKTGLDPAVEVDKFLFAVYPPEPSVTRNLLVQEFIGYFVGLVGRDKVEEIQPWPGDIKISPAMRRMPSNLSLREIAGRMQRLGGYFTGRLLERYHVALNHLEHKHFVILTGLSGTGKTSLAKFYSLAVHGIENPEAKDPFFFICPVRPDWTDPTGLIGYYDIVTNKYIVTPFLEAILIATAHKNTPVFVCIDEMNIARAEFYFADVLSAMESRVPLHLHSNSVPLEGSRGEPVPDSIALPPNLFITGTINVDESTQPLSDKILDRANTIDMSQVDVNGFLTDRGTRYPELASSISACANLLIQLDSALLPHGLGFGYRVMEEFVRYVAFVQKTGIMEDEAALDSQIAQKILIKLKGSETQRKLLEQLTRILNTYPDSLKIVNSLQNQLEEYGSFQNLR